MAAQPETSPSTTLEWQSRLFNFVVWVVGTSTRRQTGQGLLEELRDGKEKWTKQSPPKSLAENTDLALTEEKVGEDRTGSLWNVWHMNYRESSLSNQVVVFFHGGGLYLGIHSLSWGMAYRDYVRDGGDDCIIPLYSLAPYSTASQFTHTSLEMILSICDDPRYRNKDIVLYGESAGGWACWRTLLALTEVAAGKDTLGVPMARIEEWGIDRLRRARRRITKIITVGAMVETTMDHPDDITAALEDPFLSQPALRTAVRTWCHGPRNAFPAFDFKLPPASASLDEPVTITDIPLSAPCFSPGNGTAILQEYRDVCPIELKPPVLQVFQTIGTRDMLYPANERLHGALKSLTPDVAQMEFHVYPGMTHIFTVTTLTTEGADAKRKIAAAMARRTDNGD